MWRYAAYILFMICTCYCSSNNAEDTAIIGDDIKTINVLARIPTTTQHRIGFTIGSDIDTTNIFGHITDIDIYDNNIFILDGIYYNIKQYNMQGEYITANQLMRGYGPGEVINPVSMCIDSRRKLYVVTAPDMKIHTYDENHEFIKSEQRKSYVTLHSIGDEIHVLHSYVSLQTKGLIEIHDNSDLAAEEMASDRYVKQHEQFELNWTINRLQGSTRMYMTNDDTYIYVATALPFEIGRYNIDNNQVDLKCVFSPDYIGGQYEDELTYLNTPTGLILGIDVIKDKLIVYSMDVKRETHYMNIVDLDKLTYEEINISHMNVGDIIRTVSSNSYDNTLFLATNNPYPILNAIMLEFE